MKAAVCTGYGAPDVVQIRDVPKPDPKPNEVLIRVLATTVASGDARIRGAQFPPGFWLPARLALGVTRPRNAILGTELAGIVEAVGQGVSKFQPGDAVFAFAGTGFGCHAEFKCLPEHGAIALMPAGLSFDEAAAISFAGTTALHFLRDVGRLVRGERILIVGASGAVGTSAIQIARHIGAHITGVCSTANLALVRGLGADEVIDYTAEDFAAGAAQWDVIADTTGTATFARCRPALRKGGRLLLIASGLGALLAAPWQSLMSGLSVKGGVAPERLSDIEALKSLCEAGVYRPVIDSRYPLADIAAAHARASSNRKTGSVVVTMAAA